MALLEEPVHRIKRVPVPTRNPTVISTPRRGPIPLIITNPQQQPVSSHLLQGSAHQSPALVIEMAGSIDMKWQSSDGSMISPHTEEEIKSAVLASLSSSAPSSTPPTRKLVVGKKVLRWLSTCLCFIAVIVEIVFTIVFGANADTLFVLIWGPILGGWNIWRLCRLRRKRNREVISVVHLIGESLAVAGVIPLTIFSTFTIAFVDYSGYTIGDLIRFPVASFFFYAWLILHGVLLTLAAIERHKPTSLEKPTSQTSQPIVINYMPVCRNCQCQVYHSTADGALPLGGLQPQGVAPAYSPKGDSKY
ncbi:hypothetical protein F5Y16DRAFT_370183 [Xylariaceae sp. FL0255]|nr:hypothetical protein F5Y16DRAFT_370183 [Xylariaceae sp. FL0255]